MPNSCLWLPSSTSPSLILLGTRPHPKKARNTRDIKNGGMRFECVNYCLLSRYNTPSENNMKHSQHIMQMKNGDGSAFVPFKLCQTQFSFAAGFLNMWAEGFCFCTELRFVAVKGNRRVQVLKLWQWGLMFSLVVWAIYVLVWDYVIWEIFKACLKVENVFQS